jgi:hypothetical protein
MAEGGEGSSQGLGVEAMPSMAEGGEGSSQGLGVEAMPNMAQMFQVLARQLVTAILILGEKHPVKRNAVAHSNVSSDSTFLLLMGNEILWNARID